MAIRNVLHRSKLDAFKMFIKSKGLEILEPKGPFEVMRFKNTEKSLGMPIIFNGASPEHLSCNNAARPFIFEFVRGNK